MPSGCPQSAEGGCGTPPSTLRPPSAPPHGREAPTPCAFCQPRSQPDLLPRLTRWRVTEGSNRATLV
eukprot:15348933-Alexandrium_andersonii.AAC.1